MYTAACRYCWLHRVRSVRSDVLLLIFILYIDSEWAWVDDHYQAIKKLVFLLPLPSPLFLYFNIKMAYVRRPNPPPPSSSSPIQWCCPTNQQQQLALLRRWEMVSWGREKYKKRLGSHAAGFDYLDRLQQTSFQKSCNHLQEKAAAGAAASTSVQSASSAWWHLSSTLFNQKNHQTPTAEIGKKYQLSSVAIKRLCIKIIWSSKLNFCVPLYL